MKCKCGSETRIIETRSRMSGIIRRRRECVLCHNRFSTLEVPYDYIQKSLNDVKSDMDSVNELKKEATRIEESVAHTTHRLESIC